MNRNTFEIVLIAALPAAGKSALREYLMKEDSATLRERFGFGDYVSIDDRPYVVMMNRIDDVLEEMGQPRVFYPGKVSFYDGRDWATLVELINGDYRDLLAHRIVRPGSAARYYFERIDAAGETAGFPKRLAALGETVLAELAVRLEPEARGLLDEKNGNIGSVEGRTLCIEFSRGGPVGAEMPLTGSDGYQFSLPYLSAEILEKLRILYIRIDPKASLAKNKARSFVIPEPVMLRDYGCDDMEHLIGETGTVGITAHGRSWHIPVGVFDNADEKLSFLYDPKESWDAELLRRFQKELDRAVGAMSK